MPLTILVCGSRRWRGFRRVREELEALRPDLVIHGAANGADSITALVAAELGIALRAFPAEWKRYGREAGKIRNEEMLEALLSYPGERMILAFWRDDSPGTGHMISLGEHAGVKVKVIKSDGL